MSDIILVVGIAVVFGGIVWFAARKEIDAMVERRRNRAGKEAGGGADRLDAGTFTQDSSGSDSVRDSGAESGPGKLDPLADIPEDREGWNATETSDSKNRRASKGQKRTARAPEPPRVGHPRASPKANGRRGKPTGDASVSGRRPTKK
jgi:hypothetical protein